MIMMCFSLFLINPTDTNSHQFSLFLLLPLYAVAMETVLFSPSDLTLLAISNACMHKGITKKGACPIIRTLLTYGFDSQLENDLRLLVYVFVFLFV